MRTSIVSVAVLFAVGCGGPPPCRYGAWTSPPPCCSKPADLPSHAAAMQLDAEWVLYDAEAAFDALPEPARAQQDAAFRAARDAFIAADQQFIAAAARPGGQDAAERDLAKAAGDFMIQVNSWSAQTKARDRYVDARTRADTIQRHAAPKVTQRE